MNGWAIPRRLAGMLLVVGALCAPTTVALAQDGSTPPPGLGVKLLQGPADSVEDPRAHEYIVDHLEPGTTISREVGFSNGDDAPIDLDFYAAAADLTDDGFIVRPERAANDLTSWITFTPSSATVEPGETRAVTVTIAVPPDAPSGERYAAALAERVSPPAANGIATVGRVGIRVYLSIGADDEPVTAFSIDSLTASRDGDGRPVVTATVHNTGARAVDLSGTLALTNGPSSLSAGPFPTDAATTLGLDASATVTVALDPELPAGPWDAQLTLTSGLTTEVATGQLTFPSDRGTSAPPTQVETPGHFPWAAAAAIAALLMAVTLGVRRVRRGRHARHDEIDAHDRRPDSPLDRTGDVQESHQL